MVVFSDFCNLVKKFLILMTACHPSVSCAISIHYKPSHPICSGSIVTQLSHLTLGFLNWFLSFRINVPTLCLHFSCPPYMPHGSPILFSFISSICYYLMRNRSYAATLCVNLSSLLLLPPSLY
jgi:hypothetical protein